ncbi:MULTISPECIES: GNAT family N-acetyltransferase [unclassified Isoptericola]|uniref:GNAT family N-acetyltransferase n=1 Tax=unclassified Isoptericola TaxID=2623355 RepID=UPI002713D143|nr:MULTISPECIES: GNAT family N-acetyltransferase [unclassified Isoptericola]MDO8144286.1 GNAT family N-acetyltransferase [Isoptericola sp. 178]MDO8148140.1 GNAT family N-acetyltransferase [Isoptericola sp. b515]MDO8151617.1 GNAT family N-acetyltransferase [Isoptericola sp. b408]
MNPENDRPSVTLPEGWTVVVPDLADVPRLGELRALQAAPHTGSDTADTAQIENEIAGAASWTRRHLAIKDPDGVIRAWAHAHDRAAGRSVLGIEIDRSLPEGTQDLLAAWCYAELAQIGREMAQLRGESTTQLDAGAFAGDDRLRGWLTDAGFRHVRTWWQMSRPVTPADAEPGAFPDPKPGVSIRRVAQHDNGMPVAEDLNAVHQVLETAFTDHFNSYQEYFTEFVQRLREDPGHRWDHWWLACLDVPEDPEAEEFPAGALVGSELAPDDSGVRGTYVDYIGALAEARGRGVATALLYAVIADAASRGRNRVGLEVDADSPTGAESLYTKLGWRTKYVTESWHRDISVD